MDSLIIILPLPASCLNPNNAPRTAKGHKFKHFAKKAARNRAQEQAWRLCGCKPGPMWERASMTVRAYFRTLTFWDDDNLLSACKPYRDGIARAGVVVDDKDIRIVGVVMGKDKNNPRVEIEIKRCL